ncbi:processed acidic surface protein [Bacillus sp. USDA818B3_A]|uniref:processed acidic surface protein n=1 Tax=Bacillus sp. USDA818B3_A TaxID=2698834 RepID=UPI00136AE89C|nr:processed acidic surface protein [Bacillus sp. USDA818B3_A]
MIYIKTLLICFLTFPFFFDVRSAIAAPPENELNQYLTELGWTKQELLDYLAYYEIPLEDFDTVEDLKMIMGTPINSKNLQELLTKYDLTEKELNELLDHFGDSLTEYKFIEDLDASLNFYVNHDTYMADVEAELARMGITEEETEKFFNYLSLVEENNKNQLDQMTLLDSRMEKFYDVADTSELSEADLDELVDILNQSIALYEINVKFSMNNKNVTLKDLLKMKELPANLFTSVYSTSGDLLIDFTIPENFFDTGFVLDEGEEMLHVGELSDEYVDHMHNEKYENADKDMK